MGSAMIRTAAASDLHALNTVIGAAIGTWALPDRVKRLALPLYRYTEADLDHVDLRVLGWDSGIAGVAAWELAETRDLPGAGPAALLHGLYVSPEHHRRGMGTRLLEEGAAAAHAAGRTGILVRAQAGAEGFFHRRGFTRLPVRDEAREYAARYWRALY